MRTLNNKGQAGPIIGLIFAFLLIAMYAILLKPMYAFIDIAINASANVTHGALIVLIITYIPLFIALVMLIVIVLMLMGRTQ